MRTTLCRGGEQCGPVRTLLGVFQRYEGTNDCGTMAGARFENRNTSKHTRRCGGSAIHHQVRDAWKEYDPIAEIVHHTAGCQTVCAPTHVAMTQTNQSRIERKNPTSFVCVCVGVGGWVGVRVRLCACACLFVCLLAFLFVFVCMFDCLFEAPPMA